MKEQTEMSLPEKKILVQLIPEQPKLPYETVTIQTSVGNVEELYMIPEDKMQEVLDEVWPCDEEIHTYDVRYDIHSGKEVVMMDCMVIRYEKRNILVSPHYFTSGGTCIDLVEKNTDDEGNTFIGGPVVIITKKAKEN